MKQIEDHDSIDSSSSNDANLSNISSCSSTEECDSDSELDMCNSKFDPLKALYTKKKLKLPKKGVKMYDNIYHFVPTDDGVKIRENKEKSTKHKKTTFQQRRERKCQISIKKRRLNLNEEFERMLEKSVGKPLELLKKYVENNTLITIMTRNHSGFRGYMLAHLLAFDKCFNLVLSDVYHCWFRRRTERIKSTYHTGYALYQREQRNRKYEKLLTPAAGKKKRPQQQQQLTSSIEGGGSDKIRNYMKDRIKIVNDERIRTEWSCTTIRTVERIIKRFRKREICEIEYNLLLLRGCEVINIFAASRS